MNSSHSRGSQYLKKSALVVLLAILCGCATSPTGRKQLIFMPDSQMNAMGAQAFDELKQKTPRETDPAINQFVKCIAGAVAKEATEVPGVSNWDVVVFREATINAFALPGGKIGVYTGILKVTTTADQLAAIIGHEVGHVIARHGNERVSESLATQGGVTALGAVLKDGTKKDVLMAGLGIGAQFGVLLPHSRTQESEADIIGLDLMARAGFDPRQSVELWKNMAKAGGGQPPEFLSTHPSHETRIHRLESNMPTSMQTFEKARSSGHNPNCPRPKI